MPGDWTDDEDGGIATMEPPGETITVRPKRPAPRRDDRDRDGRRKADPKNADPDRKPQPPYAVIVHDDPHNGMDFVVLLFCKVFGYEVAKAAELMMEVHTQGRSIVWTGALEVAELKAEQITSAGPDPRAKAGTGPLGVTVEPLPE